MARMKDVADKAGVSVATVSNVITGRKQVSDELFKKVESAINELDYTVNLVARGLKSMNSFNIGVVMPRITNIFFPDLLNGIEDAAKKEGYTITYYSSNYDFNTEKLYIEQLKSSWVDGLIIDSCCSIEYQEEWARDLVKYSDKKKRLPVVSLERDLSSKVISSIVVENEKLSYAVTKHLIDMGRKKIFHIASHLDISIGIERFNGYKRALLESGLEFSEDYVAEGDFSSERAYYKIGRAHV